MHCVIYFTIQLHSVQYSPTLRVKITRLRMMWPSFELQSCYVLAL